jgi:hypothetical protein
VGTLKIKKQILGVVYAIFWLYAMIQMALNGFNLLFPIISTGLYLAQSVVSGRIELLRAVDENNVIIEKKTMFARCGRIILLDFVLIVILQYGMALLLRIMLRG